MEINKYKKLLEAEKVKLVKELETIGRKNPSVPGDWEAKATDLDADSADENETADELEEFEDNAAIVRKLEVQLQEVEKALQKIQNDTYSKCDICGEEIPEDRLMANPAAITCLKHTK